MTHCTRSVSLLLALGVVFGTARAGAEECPEPKREKDRKAMAKEWFARAQKAQEGGDQAEAVRAYGCSLTILPHPFTAYNMGDAAQKAGDLPAALTAYRRYLELAPKADDKADIEGRITEIESQIAKAKEAEKEPEPEPPPPPPPPVRQIEPDQPKLPAPRPPPPPEPQYRPAAWALTVGGAALIGTGVVLNIMARGKMSDCFKKFDAADPTYGKSCDAAKPLAFGSYAMFGIGGAAAATGAMLFYLGTPERNERRVSFMLSPVGTGIQAVGRF